MPRFALLVCLSLTLLPCSAKAANPFMIDPSQSSHNPTVAVDAQGTAHIAWTSGGTGSVQYCQVPRNKTSCQKPHTFSPPNMGVIAPRILIGPADQIFIYTLRCCGAMHRYIIHTGESPPPAFDADPNLDYGYLYQSVDGGSTWLPDPDYTPNWPDGQTEVHPLVVGFVAPASDVIVGPGDFSISIIGGKPGSAPYMAAPFAGYPDNDPRIQASGGAITVNLAEAGKGVNNPSFDASVALVDPLTPIVAMGDLSHVYFRRYQGGPAYNTFNSWEPKLVDLGPGDDPALVGGKRGVYIAYRDTTPPRQYLVRRYDGHDFGPPKPVTPKADPIFADFIEDRGGNLVLAWEDNGPDLLRYVVSKDGNQTWSNPKTLASAATAGGEFYDIDANAAKDAGGFVVWDQAGGKGPVRAVQFGPTGPVSEAGGGGGCVPEVKVGAATVVAREGCLTKSGNTYTTTGDVRVNGVDLFTQGSGVKLTVDTADRTLKTSGNVLVKVGNLELDDAKLGWRIPAGNGGQIQDLAGNPAVFDTALTHTAVLGLLVSGQTSPKIKSDGSVEIPVHLALPDPFGALAGLGDITGDATLRADNDHSLMLAGLKVHAKDVGIGIATIDDFVIEYVGDPSLLYGKADLSLPVTGAGINSEFRLKEGAFNFGRAKLIFPGDGILVATLVYLREIGFEMATDPTKIAGTIKLGGGPKVAGTDLISVTGEVSYTFPDAPAPGIFRAQGDGAIVNINVATIFVQYETTGKFSFGGDVHVGDDSLGAKANVEGFLDLDQGQFEVFGEAQVCVGICAGGQMLMSTKAIAGCVGGSFLGLGFVKLWSESFPSPLSSCDLDEYRISQRAHIAQSGIATVAIKKGLPMAGIELTGAGTAPLVSIAGPGGQTLRSAPGQIVNTDVGVAAMDTRNKHTVVLLRKPAAGNWTITTQPGSVPITALRQADGLPQPKVRAVVKGKGHKRVLSYTVNEVDSAQRVTLSEEGAGAYNMIGTTRGRHGKIRFSPGNGKAGKRRIFAAVEQNGVPRAQLVAGSYIAPGPLRPSRPKGLRLRRKGSKLLVSWRKAKGAVRYVVRVKLKDGRRLAIPTTKHSLVIRGVPGIDSGTIAVMGLRADNTAGGAATKKLATHPKKLRRKKRG